MHSLKPYNDRSKALSDLLDWAALMDDGIVQGKSGALLAGWFYRGQDIASSTADERNYITQRINATLARLGGGWSSWHDAVRLPSASYPPPENSYFPDEISALIDRERREQFMREGSHFESEYAFVVQFIPPLRQQSKIVDLIYDDDGLVRESVADRTTARFKEALGTIENSMGDVVRMRRMRSYTHEDRSGRAHLRDELVDYLQFCLTGEIDAKLNIPTSGMYLDAVMGGRDLWGGDTPRLGDKFIMCVAIEGFPAESSPGVLDVLDHLAIPYRWSSRFIYLEQHEALAGLRKYRRKWRQAVRGFTAQIFKTQGGIVNEDALLMVSQAEAAMTDANSSLVTFGYYTPVIVLMDRSRVVLEDNARIIAREIAREGFTTRIETINTMEAWLGSLPGHLRPNVRRPLIHTLNLSDLLPLAAVWPGLQSNPCPLFPEDSPPLLHAATSGATPFRLNLHVGDVGHTLVFGPTGAGKSVLLCTVAAQFRRYDGATICAFDKGRSMLALVKACGGGHYDIGADGKSPTFCPLSVLETAGDLAWAEDWIATCYQLQTDQAPTPRQREEIHRAMLTLQGSPLRSLTDFNATVQDEAIRSALMVYTISGSLGHLLDSREDSLSDDPFVVFELDELMSLRDSSAIPVLLYLFRRFERSLKGQPALLSLDEAWIMLGHPVFREKIRDWLKTLRKANCAVLMATQSLSDAVRSGILDVLMESCPTKIMLPNEEADKIGTAEVPGPGDLYRMMGLNDAQIGIIKAAIKKRHYYYASPEGRRLFDLGLGPVALSFVAVGDKDSIRRIEHLEQEFGARWPAQWLEEKEVDYTAYA
ncbi:transporter [Acidisoma sp. S159]|uniref:VirB4 family type IV secretion/conjugal transfer ATPase n=1 Tax=Acidisoma sp. S159 TaxID=1747225 RepID=UPI00131D10F4|nr:transporter [Acidisoma sp. S159]